MKTKKRIFTLCLAVILIFSSGIVTNAKNAATSFLPDSDPFETIETIKNAVSTLFWSHLRRFIDFFAIDCDFIFSEFYEDFRYDTITALDDGFIPQGLCYVDALECFAVSGYSDDGDSRIYLEKGDIHKTVILKGYTGHAGGIASYGNDIYVCSGGSESSYGKIYRLETDNIKDIFNNEEDIVEVSFSGSFETYVKASFMGTADGKLFVGEFYNKDNKTDPNHKRGKNNALAYGYDLPLPDDAFDGVKPLPSVALSVPDQVQGFTEKSGDMIFSTSYGRRNSSYLQVFENYKDWEASTITVSDNTEIPLYISARKNRIARMNMPTLMEGIAVQFDSLYVVFESGAEKYSDTKEINDCVVGYNYDKMISHFR